MKSIKLVLLTISICLFLSGCASTNKSHIFSPVSVSVNSELNADIEVDMSKKLTGSASATYWMGLIKLFLEAASRDMYIMKFYEIEKKLVFLRTLTIYLI